MSTRSLSRSFFAALACTLLAMPAMADSQARIVRLSDVHGSVQIDKNTGLGFENAFLNLPVTQGTQLKTLANGRAEIEFEDGSTMRLGPNSSVEFSTLGLNDSGKRISVVNLASGMAYVNWMGKDDFSLNFSHEKVALDHAAHFRVEDSASAANLAIFKGDVEVESPTGKVTVEKKKTATFDAEDKSTIANKIAEEPLDSWDKESASYHDEYAKNNISSPYGYGLSDLNYYGAYSNVPGYGMMWQPYFTGVGWDPFMDGAWGFYPGMGFMFASAYPWGWLPYRYGNWMFVPAYGWMWQPGGWNSYAAVPRYTATNLVTVHSLVAPTQGTKTVVVGKGGPVSTLASSRMVVNSGSAGMGIQRGSLSNLKDLNHQVAKSGFAEVHPTPQFGATSRANSGFGASERGGMSAGSSMHSAPAGHAAAPAGGGAVHH
jgi:FecR protein